MSIEDPVNDAGGEFVTGLLALQSLESNPQLSFATRMEDWTSLGQQKRHPEFPVVTREKPRGSPVIER